MTLIFDLVMRSVDRFMPLPRIVIVPVARRGGVVGSVAVRAAWLW